MWWRRSWFSLNGKVGIRRSEKGQSSYVGPARSATGRIHATTPPAGLSGYPEDVLGKIFVGVLGGCLILGQQGGALRLEGM